MSFEEWKKSLPKGQGWSPEEAWNAAYRAGMERAVEIAITADAKDYRENPYDRGFSMACEIIRSAIREEAEKI